MSWFTAPKLLLAMLCIVVLNSVVVVLSVVASTRADSARHVAAVAQALALTSCRGTVTAREDANANRELDLLGWRTAFFTRMAEARTATGVDRRTDLDAARIYRKIVNNYTFVARPQCMDILATGLKWHKPLPLQLLPSVPVR